MWINQCLAFLERWALYDCPHFTIAISDTILSFFLSFCLLIVFVLFVVYWYYYYYFIFLYNSRSKVMLMLTSTSSRNIQLLHFFFYFPQKNWPYNLRDMNIIWQTMFTTGSNEARGLGHSQETMRKTNPPSCHMASQ